jgi:hypothetical protein
LDLQAANIKIMSDFLLKYKGSRSLEQWNFPLLDMDAVDAMESCIQNKEKFGSLVCMQHG